MMVLSERKKYLLATIVVLVFAFLLQYLQEYRFYAKEAEHLWLNDWMWIEMHLYRPGGFVQVLTSFFTQFFQFWGIGTISLSLLFGLAIFLCMNIGKSFRMNDCFATFWTLPLVFMALCNEHSYYNLKGHFAFAISLLLACLYLRFFRSRSIAVWTRILTVIIIISLGYLLVGSAVLVTTVVILLFELLLNKNWLASFASVLTFVLCAGFAVKVKYFIDMEYAMTPLQYYAWPTTYFFPLYTWFSVPLILLIGKWLSKEYTKTIHFSILCCGILVSVVSFVNMYSIVHNEKVYQQRKDEWMVRNEDWDGIIDAHKTCEEPTPFISYLNLALAKKGELVKRMSEFKPYILWSEEAKMYSPVLMTHDELSRDALKLQSCVFMNWGGMALANAQKSAFEANLLTPGDTDPVELQRLIITNSVFNTQETAEKYQRRLAKTSFYKNKLLSKQVLQKKVEDYKKTLPEEDSFYMKTQIGKMLHDIVVQTPDNKIAAQFYEAYLIQSQDSVAYRHWMENKDNLDL